MEKKLLKFETEGQEFAKILRSQEQFAQTGKGQNNYNSNWKRLMGLRNMQEKLEKHSVAKNC